MRTIIIWVAPRTDSRRFSQLPEPTPASAAQRCPVASQSFRRRRTGTLVDTLKVDSFSFAEQFMLWAIRVSLSGSTTTTEANNTLTEAFRLLRIPSALRPFLDFVGVAAVAWHNAQYMPDVRCTCCSTVGEDEWRLLQILAALQRRDLNLAACWLRNVLPPAGTRILITSGLQVANSLQQRGCMLSIAATTRREATVHRHAEGAPLH